MCQIIVISRIFYHLGVVQRISLLILAPSEKKNSEVILICELKYNKITQSIKNSFQNTKPVPI